MTSLPSIGASQFAQLLPFLQGGGLSALLGPIGMIGGGLASGIGDLLGASQQNRAIRRAEDDNTRDLRGQMGGVGAGIFGPSYGSQPLYQFLYGQGLERQDPAMVQQGLAGINDFINAQGGPVIQQQRNLANNTTGRQTANLASFDNDTQRLHNFSGATGANLGNFMASARDDLLRGARGAEDMADIIGAGRSQTISRDAGRELSRANQDTERSMMNRGLANSTALVGAQQANRSRINESRDRALQANSDSRFGNRLAARSQTLGLQSGANAQIAGAMERLGENQIGREYQRASDRSGLLDRHLTRDIGLQQDPINTMHSTLTGGIMNPYGAQSFSPQASSGSASLLSSLGNAAAGFGSYLTGRNMQMDLLRQLLGQP